MCLLAKNAVAERVIRPDNTGVNYGAVPAFSKVNPVLSLYVHSTHCKLIASRLGKVPSL